MTDKSLCIAACMTLLVGCGDDTARAPDLGADQAQALALPAPMSIPTSRTTPGVTAGGGGAIFVLGGVGAAYLPAVEVLDPKTGAWQKRAIMPTARAGLGAAAGSDGRIFAVGGGAGAQPPTPFDVAEVYTPDSDRWTTLPPMPTARLGLAAVAGKDGRIYAIGGRVASGEVTGVVEIYTPSTNAWTAAAPLATPRQALAAVVASDGRIYAIGGRATDDSSLPTVEAYDPASDKWTERAPLSSPRYWLAAVAVGDKLHVLGGVWASQVLDDHLVYDPAANAWAERAALPAPRAYGGAALAPDGSIFLVAGAGQGATPIAEVWRYAPAADAWTP